MKIKKDIVYSYIAIDGTIYSDKVQCLQRELELVVINRDTMVAEYEELLPVYLKLLKGSYTKEQFNTRTQDQLFPRCSNYLKTKPLKL
jgi:hypothetical protein